MTTSDGPDVCGAIPFCFQHGASWQADCLDCQRAQPVRTMLDAHVALYPLCEMWPLCDCQPQDV